MAFTISRYLKLKIADDLSSDAKYNLEKIDSLGAIFARDTESDTNIRSSQNIALLPEDASIGGSGNNSGSITLGDSNNKATITAHSVDFFLRSALSLLNQSASVGTANYLKVRFLNDTDITTNRTLTIDVDGANRSISFPVDGEVVTADASQTLTNKTISGSDNTLSNIGYSSLLLANSIVNADISSSAAIATSKLSGPVTAIASNGLGTLAGQNTASLTTDVTGILPIANGGTGQATAAAAIEALLPAYAGKSLSVLRVNVTENGIEWATGAGAGTVTNVAASSPLVISGDPQVSPTISLPAATALASGHLTSTDWSTFNSKEPAIAAGTTGQYWRGDKSWQTLDKSAVGLSNVDNTSDVNKPISSATQTALNAKYDSSNPASYVDAAGARTAAVVNSTAGSETDQAASVAAMKSYISSQGGGAIAYTWSTADGVTKSITHSLNKNTVSVTVYDENGEDILVDTVDRTSNNAVSLTSSVAPTGNWTVIIRP